MLDAIPRERIDDHAELGERAVWGGRFSECFLQPGAVPEHSHPHDGLALLLGGNLDEKHEGVWHRLSAGRVLRQFRDRSHSLRVGRAGAHVFRVRFRLDADLPQAAPLAAPSSALPVMQRLYALFVEPSSHDAILGAWMLDAEQSLKRERRCRSATPDWTDDAERLLVEQGQPADLVRIADLLGVSRIRLNRAFHQRHGCNPAEWLRRRRVFSACQRLRAGGQSIAEIAMELGYADQAHFSRLFKQVVGTSPLRYRKLGP